MKAAILVIGRHPDIMQTVLRLINQHEGWYAEGALTDEEAMTLCKQRKFDLVLLGGGIEEVSERHLRSAFSLYDPELRVIQHYGGGSGLLSNEIMQALEQKANSR